MFTKCGYIGAYGARGTLSNVKLEFGKETIAGNIIVDMYAKFWFEC